ncbi:elicitor-responsive protein 1-like [Aristolochia californica]|uniref:elicitor-responsive protein 1-like n=1 Tax=Aristolochia californica TaxID=171875 RepID=UPI0035DAB520
MPSGILEAQLVDARGLCSTDFLNKIDPYVLIQYKTQERKSSVARGQGSNPVWNEKFTFLVDYPGDGNQCKLVFKIMDKDTFSRDDLVGEASMYIEELLAQGVERGKAELHPAGQRVTLANKTYHGEIRVGVSFTRKDEPTDDQEEYGGWKHGGNRS